MLDRWRRGASQSGRGSEMLKTSSRSSAASSSSPYTASGGGTLRSRCQLVTDKRETSGSALVICNRSTLCEQGAHLGGGRQGGEVIHIRTSHAVRHRPIGWAVTDGSEHARVAEVLDVDDVVGRTDRDHLVDDVTDHQASLPYPRIAHILNQHLSALISSHP